MKKVRKTTKRVKKKTKGIGGVRHIVVVSDLHIGCQLGLCPKDGGRQAEGGVYTPSAFQQQLYSMWDAFWNDEIPRITEGEPYDIVINGDILDGSHHQSVSQWTHNITDQAAAALEILQPIRDACRGQFYVIRGTEVHVGKSGQDEEWLARELKAVPTKTKQFSRYELWKKLGGGLIHFTHHIGTTSSSAYESTAVYRELVESFVEAARWKERPPDVIVRSHRHRHFVVEVATGNGKATSVVTPAWQGKTPFAHRIAGARQSQPQFGGIILTWSRKERFIYERHRVWRLDRPEAE